MLPLRPLPLGDFSIGYFEVQLINTGEEQYLLLIFKYFHFLIKNACRMIGIGIARENYLDAMPGWKKGSIGYHGDDGRVFIGCGYGMINFLQIKSYHF